MVQRNRNLLVKELLQDPHPNPLIVLLYVYSFRMPTTLNTGRGYRIASDIKRSSRSQQHRL